MVNRVTCFAPVPGSILYVHPCHPRGTLPAHWACRMFSGPWGIVVVHVSWPGHPTLIKKKKKRKSWTKDFLWTLLESVFLIGEEFQMEFFKALFPNRHYNYLLKVQKSAGSSTQTSDQTKRSFLEALISSRPKAFNTMGMGPIHRIGLHICQAHAVLTSILSGASREFCILQNPPLLRRNMLGIIFLVLYCYEVRMWWCSFYSFKHQAGRHLLI